MNQTKIIILDLDHTLIHSIVNKKDINYGDFEIMLNEVKYSIFKRPNLHSFLNNCETYFDHIIIWSLGTKKYVSRIIKTIFANRPTKPLIILNRNHCYYKNGRWCKDMKILKDILPTHNINFHDCHFFFVDDIIRKIKPTKNANIIEIKRFDTIMSNRLKSRYNFRKRKREIDIDDSLIQVIKRFKNHIN